MELNKTSNLINLIAEKERKEKQKKIKMILLGIGGVAIVGGGLAAFTLIGSGDSPDNSRTFEASQLTHSQVTSLFEQSEAPVMVKNTDSGRIDTIYSPEEYRLYLSTRTVAVQLAEATNGTTTDAEVADPAMITSPLTRADILPSFPGGEAALYRFLSNQIRYPDEAQANRIEGKVYIRFVVQSDGAITDLDVLRGIGYGCDREALRVVQLMPRWVPGELAGTKVPVYSSLAIEFKFLGE